ncbi:MAG TPA: DNA cytosine methyltransferase [Bryobacteraceae bacterium]
MRSRRFRWYEFFAGGGLARLGLGSRWECTFANELCPKKAAAYRAYFGECPELRVADVATLTTADIPGCADLAWGSFPCQDLSLAGAGKGLNGNRSGTLWPFWRLIAELGCEGRSPRMVVLENVVGALTSHGGADFGEIVRAMAEAGYRVGALVIDAARFLPQSRPRLFVVGVRTEASVPAELEGEGPGEWHTRGVREAFERLPEALRRSWIWWALPSPSPMPATLAEVVENAADWHDAAYTRRLIELMSERDRGKLRKAQAASGRVVGTIYRRTREVNGGRRQRAEVRFDGIAGCLRTPAGGSSRQTLVIVEGARVRSRLLTAREAARLMGVPDDYPTPDGYNEAYHLFGDGLAVPVVSYLEQHLLSRLACGAELQLRGGASRAAPSGGPGGPAAEQELRPTSLQTSSNPARACRAGCPSSRRTRRASPGGRQP